MQHSELMIFILTNVWIGAFGLYSYTDGLTTALMLSAIPLPLMVLYVLLAHNGNFIEAGKSVVAAYVAGFKLLCKRAQGCWNPIVTLIKIRAKP